MLRRHEHKTVDLSDSRNVCIAVLSDTHGRPDPALFSMLQKFSPSLILHAGDVGGSDLLTEMKGIADVVHVRGNVDPVGPAWPDAVSLRIVLGDVNPVEMLLLHIAMANMRLLQSARDLLRQDPAQVVIFGHSHVPFLGTEGTVTLFNPGSAGPRRWSLPTTFGLIEVVAGQLRFKHLDLHAGGEWRPAALGSVPTG